MAIDSFEDQNPVLRFAISPVGHLSLYQAQIALINWFFAKSREGQFLVRYDDLDKKNAAKYFKDEIKDALGWLGISADHDIFHQSDRPEKYFEMAEILLDKNLAYRSKDHSSAVFFRCDLEQAIEFKDLVQDQIRFEADEVGDFAIIKEDGTPSRSFASVVDDYFMGVTHVIRSSIYLVDTPKEILISNALGFEPIAYGHIPTMMDDEGSYISSSVYQEGFSVLSFLQEGFLAPALNHYLLITLLGKEKASEVLFDKGGLQKFSLEEVRKSNFTFDEVLIRQVNMEHIQRLSETSYLEMIYDYLDFMRVDIRFKDPVKVEALFLLYQGWVETLGHLLHLTYYFFEEVLFDKQAVYDGFNLEDTQSLLESSLNDIHEMNFETAESIKNGMTKLAQNLEVDLKELLKPIRIAITGRAESPNLFEIMKLLGREKVIYRIQFVVKYFDELVSESDSEEEEEEED